MTESDTTDDDLDELLEDDDYADEKYIMVGSNHAGHKKGDVIVPTKTALENFGHKFDPITLGGDDAPCPFCDPGDELYPRAHLEKLTDDDLRVVAALSEKDGVDGNDDPADIIDALAED
ncbi:hypothetical protein [Natronorubrum sp. FCH18a]|uniref:hypothetical protein n=1 Tax=Natronorubrum sp. FCH18a TaxID=3447018 RepID=UPI003F5154AC